MELKRRKGMKSFKLIITSMVLLAVSLAGAQAYGADTAATFLMEEGAGIITYSLPGNYYFGDLVGGVAWDASTPNPSSNWCLDFDGVNGHVWTDLITESWSDITVEAWVYFNFLDPVTPGNSNYAIADSDWIDGFFLHTWGDDIGLFLGKTPLYANDSFETGTWYHVAFTWDGSGPGNNLKLYINGQLKNQRRGYHVKGSLQGADASNYEVYFGATAWTQTLAMDGKIDDVKIVNEVLSPGQIAFDYQSGLLATYSPEGIVTASANLGAVVEWTSQFGATYQIEWSPDNSNWVVRDSAVIGNGDTMRWNDSDAGAFHQTGSSYYKVTKIQE